MQENNQPPIKINEEKLLKRLKKEARETIDRVESGLYEKVYNYRREEIIKLYPDENEDVAKNAALKILEQMREEDMDKYDKAKEFLERIKKSEGKNVLVA